MVLQMFKFVVRPRGGGGCGNGAANAKGVVVVMVVVVCSYGAGVMIVVSVWLLSGSGSGDRWRWSGHLPCQEMIVDCSHGIPHTRRCSISIFRCRIKREHEWVSGVFWIEVVVLMVLAVVWRRWRSL